MSKFSKHKQLAARLSESQQWVKETGQRKGQKGGGRGKTGKDLTEKSLRVSSHPHPESCESKEVVGITGIVLCRK